MKTLIVYDFVRPSLKLKEKEENGVFTPEKMYWAAVNFKVKDLSEEDVVGKYSEIVLQIDHQESWKFYEADVMLSPFDGYILTYSEVEYVCKVA